MLSNIVIILLALILPVSAFFSFRAGYQIGRAVKKEEELPQVVKRSSKPPAMTEEQRRIHAILANIDAYDGTGGGQVKL